MPDPSREELPGRNRRVVLYGNPVLRRAALEVRELTPDIRRFLADLKTTMLEQDGLGLAGNQLGEPIAAFAVNPRGADTDQEPYCIINPRVVATEGELEREEGCLSLPGIYEVIARPEFIRITGLDEEGRPVEREAAGLLARAFLHETDHLNGRLFIDYLSELRRSLLARALAEIADREAREAES